MSYFCTMLEGRNLILATRSYAKDDRKRSWQATISTIIVLAIGFFCALYPFHIGIRIAGSLLAGLTLIRFFCIYHDYLHHTILYKSKAANVIFTIFGLYILAPKSIWKRSHDHHHKNNSKLYSSGIGSFPIVTKEGYKKLSRGERLTYLFIRHPLTIAFGYIFAFTWGMCILSLTRNSSKHWDSALALLFHFGIGAVIFFSLGWVALLLGFLVPSLISSALGTYLFYAQHNFPTATFANQDDWTYIGAALKSSSYMKMNPLMHWFTANIGYHHIHHTNARIPFYRLPQVYKDFPEFQDAKTTSLNPMDIFRCLQLKVWDPEANRMLRRSEIRA